MAAQDDALIETEVVTQSDDLSTAGTSTTDTIADAADDVPTSDVPAVDVPENETPSVPENEPQQSGGEGELTAASEQPQVNSENTLQTTVDDAADKVELPENPEHYTIALTTVDGGDEGKTYFTVTPDAGYEVEVKATKGENTDVEVTQETEKGKDVYSVTLKENETVTITVEATATEYTVTVTNNAATAVTEVKYAKGSEEYKNYTDVVKVTVEDTLKLQLTVDDKYSAAVKAKVGEEDAKPVDPEDTNGVYTFSGITADTTIDITAEKTELDNYAVTTEITKDGDDETATVAFEGKYNATDKTIAEGSDLVFTVTPNPGRKVTQVTYKIKDASDDATELTVAEGKYTVAGSAITGDITIAVTTANKEYTLAFNVIGATVEYKTTGSDTATEWKSDSQNLTLKFNDTVTFTVKPDDNTKFRYVSMKSDGSEPMNADASGQYTYTVGEETEEGLATVYVLADALKTIDVTFPGLTTQKMTVYKVESAEKDGATTYTGTTIADNKISATEDSTVSFAIDTAADSLYTIKDVSVAEGSGTLTQDMKPVTLGSATDPSEVILYILNLKDVTAAVDVTVDTSYDRAKVNAAEFSVSCNDVADGEADDAYKATINGKEYVIGSEYLTEDASVSFSITPAEYYKLEDDIVVLWEKPEEETPKDTRDAEPVEYQKHSDILTPTGDTYTLTFDKTKGKQHARIAVQASIEALETDNTITFNTTDGIHSIAVTEIEITDAEGNPQKVVEHVKGNIYRLKQGAQWVEFTVNVKENYDAPELTASDADLLTKFPNLKDVTGVENTLNKVKVTSYTYKIPAAFFANEDDTVIDVDAKAATKNLTVSYNEDEVEVYVKQNGVEFDGEVSDYDAENQTWKLPLNQPAVLVVTALDNCKITEFKEGTTKKTMSPAGGEYSIAKMTVDKEITIASEALYTIQVVDAKNSDIVTPVPKTGVYNVDFTGEYTITAYKGAKTEAKDALAITAADVSIVGQAQAEPKSTAALAADKKSVTFKIDAAEANKKLTLTLTCRSGEAENATEKQVTYTFQTTNKIASVTVAGVQNGALSQTADTAKEYKLTVTPKSGINSDKLAVEILSTKDKATETENTAAAALLAGTKIADGKLTIVTKAFSETEWKNSQTVKEAKLQIVDTNYNKEKEADNYTIGAPITVTVTEPTALTELTPAITQTTATDTTLTVKLDAGKAQLDTPKAGKLWYEITVASQEDKPAASITGAAGTFYVAKDDAAAQEATLLVNNAKVGEGAAHSYTLTAKLVQMQNQEELETTDKIDELKLTKVHKKAASKATPAFASKVSASLTASTKDVYYETKLTLKKDKTTTATVYTGQTAKIAIINWGANTTFKLAEATDKSGLGKTTLKVEDNAVYMTVEKGAATGTRTIRVTAKQPGATYPVYADIKVTVVRGIESLSIVPASNSIYKADKKAATLKVTPIYNDDTTGKNKTLQPKTKKLAYTLVQTNGTTAYVHPYVSINKSNGTITVNKNYNAITDTNNTFQVKATAIDFNGNETSDVSETIEITNEALTIGRVVIVKAQGGGKYKVVAETGDINVLSDELVDTQVIAFAPGTPQKETYTQADMDNYALNGVADNPNHLTFKSNNKAVAMNASGAISGISKVARNITITVSANDGSKKSAVLKFDVVYAQPKYLGIRVEQQSNDGTYIQKPIFEDGAAASANAEQSLTLTDSTKDTVLKLSVVQRETDAEDWKPAYQLSNVSIAVKGGAVLSKADAYGSMTIIASSPSVTVTLTNKASKPFTTQKLTIVNSAAVTDVKVLRKYSAVTTATKSVSTSIPNDTKIVYKLHDKDIDLAKYTNEADQLYVMVKADSKDASNVKNTTRYAQFAERSNINGFQPVSDVGTFSLNITGDEDNALTAGTYKLQLTFGKISKETGATYGKFVAESQPLTVNVKVVKPKTVKATFKPVTTLKMSFTDKAQVALTGSGKNYDKVVFNNLQNVNTCGMNKPLEEKFDSYFDIVTDKDDTNIITGIKLKDNLTEAQIALITSTDSKNSVAKNARTAYVDYTTVSNDKNVIPVSGTVKITVQFTKNGGWDAAATYTASASKMLQGQTTAWVDITSAKKPATVAYAIVKGNDSGKLVSFDLDVENSKPDGSRLKLKSKSELAVGKYDVTLGIILDDVYAKDKAAIATAYTAWQNAATDTSKQGDYVEAVTKCRPVIVKTTIEVVAKDNSTKKIDIAKSELTKKEWDYSRDSKQQYTASVTYKKLLPEAVIQDIQVKSAKAAGKTLNTTELLENFYIDFDHKNIGDDSFNIYISKANLNAADKAYKDIKGNANKTLYGTTITVTAKVNYGKRNDKNELVVDEAIKADEFTFTITLPKKNDEAAGSYADAVKAIQAAKTDLANEIAKALNYKDYEEGSGEYIKAVTAALSERLAKIAPPESDTIIEITTKSDSFTAPTSVATGSLVLNVQLTDSTYTVQDGQSIPADKQTTVEFAFTIPATGEQPSDLQSILNNYVTTNAGAYAKRWNVTAADIIADARADKTIADKLKECPTLRFDVRDVQKTDATTDDKGSISGKFHVWGIKYGGDPVDVDFSFAIDQLDKSDEIQSKIENALSGGTWTNKTTKEDIAEAIDNAYMNPQIKWEWAHCQMLTLQANPQAIQISLGTNKLRQDQTQAQLVLKPAASSALLFSRKMAKMTKML